MLEGLDASFRDWPVREWMPEMTRWVEAFAKVSITADYWEFREKESQRCSIVTSA